MATAVSEFGEGNPLLKGKGLSSVVIEVSTSLNQEAPLPYFFDIVEYDSKQNKDLREITLIEWDQ
ncbi:hypothetical protein SCG7086_AX_00060 [Chlamydiales bacterium SCGC AG-110-P3]|nr:hypothetical protein SCG7086_AX_00060 [Chlamydiales bacterium SCGC AG-110-P3]